MIALITSLVAQYGRYGYRRITAMLGLNGWKVNHKRVERIWKIEGLKVPQKQPKRRQVLVEMTEKGKQVYRRFVMERKVIPRIIESLSHDERDHLISTLGKLGKSVNQELRSVPRFL